MRTNCCLCLFSLISPPPVGRLLDDSVRHRAVQPLSQYRLQPTSLYRQPGRVSEVLMGVATWSELPVVTAVDSDSELLFPEDMWPEPRGRGAGEFRRRIKFSREKDEALIRFVTELGRQRYAPPTAPNVWQMKAFLLPALLAVHPPLSLHTHFIKQVRRGSMSGGSV